MVTLPQPRFRGRSSDVELWLSAFTPEKRALELNGALSNPRAEVELSRLRDVQKRLLLKAAANHMEPRPAPARPSPVLETITRVLELESRPMRAREIHSAAEELLGRPLLWKSVKGPASVMPPMTTAVWPVSPKSCSRYSEDMIYNSTERHATPGVFTRG